MPDDRKLMFTSEYCAAFRRPMVSTTGIAFLMIVVVFSCALVVRAQAESASKEQLPAFEVASIKPDTSNSNMMHVGGPDVSRYTATNVTVRMLIINAFHVKNFQISGGPSWIDSHKFDIDAKVEDSLAASLERLPKAQQEEQKRLMLQSLLADRFKLKVSHQTKELPVYALVVAKGGSKLTEVPPPDAQSDTSTVAGPGGMHGSGPQGPPPGGMMMFLGEGGKANLTGKAAPISDLAGTVSQLVGRQVLDQTGLKGTYDFTLQWISENGFGGGMPAPPMPGMLASPMSDTGGASIFTALQEQLGLRLESTKGPVDTIVIQSIEEPTEN